MSDGPCTVVSFQARKAEAEHRRAFQQRHAGFYNPWRDGADLHRCGISPFRGHAALADEADAGERPPVVAFRARNG